MTVTIVRTRDFLATNFHLPLQPPLLHFCCVCPPTPLHVQLTVLFDIVAASAAAPLNRCSERCRRGRAVMSPVFVAQTKKIHSRCTYPRIGECSCTIFGLTPRTHELGIAVSQHTADPIYRSTARLQERRCKSCRRNARHRRKLAAVSHRSLLYSASNHMPI
jgi:hypothetical protein